MIRRATLLFCDNEHGAGDFTFPDLDEQSAAETKQEFIEPRGVGALRKAAKAAGWGRVNGADYCPGCMENPSE